MEALTLKRAIELAEEVVAEFGEDYEYPKEHKRVDKDSSIPSCVYVHEGKPSCLVGQVLHRHGVPLWRLSLHEFKDAHTVSFRVADASASAAGFLYNIQGLQDRGNSWGEALEEGKRQVNLY